jgi:hypothetical protein
MKSNSRSNSIGNARSRSKKFEKNFKNEDQFSSKKWKNLIIIEKLFINKFLIF